MKALCSPVLEGAVAPSSCRLAVPFSPSLCLFKRRVETVPLPGSHVSCLFTCGDASRGALRSLWQLPHRPKLSPGRFSIACRNPDGASTVTRLADVRSRYEQYRRRRYAQYNQQQFHGFLLISSFLRFFKKAGGISPACRVSSLRRCCRYVHRHVGPHGHVGHRAEDVSRLRRHEGVGPGLQVRDGVVPR